MVGAVFAIIAMTTSIGYITYSMHLLDSYSQTFLSTNQERSDKQRENFKIVTFSVVNNKLNLGVQNTGDIPINVTRLWVQNTTTTDWFQTYSIKTNVSPGTTASNIGQSIPLYINSANSYNIKLVTERGNSQQFTLNTASSAPLNIQLLALPPNIASGFKTQLVMIVANNGSSTLTNLVPASLAVVGTPSATCTPDQVSPSIYNTLPPGQTAVFSWPVKVRGTADGQTCTYSASLQNGYPKNNANATITVSAIQLSSTTFAQNSGILTLNFTTFQWTQGGQWNTGWSMPGGQYSAFKLNVTNNNATTSSNLYISRNTMILLADVSNSHLTPYFLVNATTLSPLGVTSYTCGGPNDFCTSLPYGKQVTLYFGATARGMGTMQKCQNSNTQAMAFLIAYGKYSTSQTASGSLYGQNLPYLGLEFS